jgi:coproporphyrinogen III oxidase
MGNLKLMRARAEMMARQAQVAICDAIEKLDGTSFAEDVWTSPDGGTSYTDRVLRNGHVFQTVGVNAAVARGTFTPDVARVATGGRLQIREELPYFVTGVSLVIHAKNPMVPSSHANYRYFEVGDDDTAPVFWWFGGGADLTPYYLFEEDAVHFHRVHKQVCDRYDSSFYPQFKKWCDEYFHIVHRGERRGVGGIFFDNLNDRDQEALFAFVTECADVFIPAYLPIVQRRHDLGFTERHQHWRQLRSGRYIEFNLTYDRGTTFGLKSGGRITSILMGLPTEARWEHEHHPVAGSEEAQVLEVLRNPREWL